jgi:hypothetical protein
VLTQPRLEDASCRIGRAVRTRRYIPSSTLHLTNSYHCSCAVPIPILCYAMLFYAKFPSHEASVLPRLPAAPCVLPAVPPRKRVNPNPHTRLFLSILGSTIRTPSLAITKCIVKKSRKYIYLSNRPVHADPRMPCSLQMRSSLMPCSRLRSSQFVPS